MESDIARKKILTRSARNAWELGKSLGVQIIGNEEDVMEELVRCFGRVVISFMCALYFDFVLYFSRWGHWWGEWATVSNGCRFSLML
ncbi:hypothetical protein V6N13_090675 [Hibiscus sabdariffa]